MNSIDLDDKQITLTSPSCFIQEHERYFVYFPKIACKTEYTKEGYRILKMCKSGANLGDLSRMNNIPVEDIKAFILQENAKEKLRIE